MCGIYAVAGESAQEKVFNGIKRIEYRGYDSWGVAGIFDSKTGEVEIKVHKQVGKIGQVKKLPLAATELAIGHTRWATHGGVTQTNAHPHLASDESFALVQNGVVENYQELKKDLEKKGKNFKTQTDTEVIVRLIELLVEKLPSKKITISLLFKAFKQLKGRSTVVVMTREGALYAYRNGSPLVVGSDDQGAFYLSSDVLSMSADANSYQTIDNQELVSIIDGEVVIYGSDQKLKKLKLIPITVQATNLDKEGHPHFMVKEIQEQSSVFHQMIKQEAGLWEELLVALKKAGHVYTLGAGSASFAAGQAAWYLRSVGVNATAIPAYEASSYRSLFKKGDLCIAFSQSGETADTNEVIELLKTKGVKIASLVNMAGATLTALSDYPFMLQVGPEVAIASTKALTGQMMWGKVVAELVDGVSLKKMESKIKEYERQLAKWLSDKKIQSQLARLSKRFEKVEHMFVLGRGQLYFPTLEFALKMKEISYIHAEGFSGGELKHGVIALIEKGTPVISLIASDEEQSAMINAVAEVKARGAYVIGVSQDDNSFFDTWIPLPKNQDMIHVSSIIPSQLLTYKLALSKKYDPDKPRNLAKSVTVK